MALQYPRFERNYELVFGTGATAVTVRPPFRIAFDGNKSFGSLANRLNVDIYNLTPANRQALVRDEVTNADVVIPIQLSVGYQDRLETIFKGTVHRGFTGRNGVDFISRLECLDGGADILNSFVSTTVIGAQQLVDAILADMPNLTAGQISRRGDLIRPRVLVGNAAKLLEDVANGDELFIDQEQVYIIKSDEAVTLNAVEVSPNTGLLNTPERDQGIITFETMLNPAIRLGGVVSLESTTAPHLNGIYRVDTITYKGDYEGTEWLQLVRGVQSANFRTVR